MATLSLKISVVDQSVIKTMQFEPSCIVYDACRMIRERIPEASPSNPGDFGLFLADDDPKKGVWLEQGRSLEYYLLRNGDLIEYKKKHRFLKVRTLDGMTKKLQVDDSHTIGSLMITICSRMGITNHEEYSLVRDLGDDEKEKTLTLKRDKSIAKDQKKLEEMKKKLHTDDELNWLDHSKTLREQDIDPNEELLLRRKFFYSDQNVDARDPVQLNLLYVQTRDAILNGAHPVSMEKAIEFGGLQCQVQFGDHNDARHKPGFLDLKEFLPKEYVKIKSIEKKIYAEHKRSVGLSEVEAKVKYTHICRSLKTYGITFFLVKEKMRGKNKLVPRLLGITKESVVRVDEKTKEIMKTWPLTTVRRWAASPNSFTLDFGDYSDTYYSVQTTEGEQISQLIAGYIDIILRKKKNKDHLGIDGDDNSTMYEENVQAGQATIIQHNWSNAQSSTSGNVSMPGLLRDGYQGENKMSMGSLHKGQVSSLSQQSSSGFTQQHGGSGHLGDISSSSGIAGMSGSSMDSVDGAPPSGAKGTASSGKNAQRQELTQAQRAFIVTITDGLSAIDAAQSDLDHKDDLPTLGDDPASKKWRENQMDLSKQKVGSQLSAMNAATAQLVTLTSAEQDELDYTAVGAAVNQISSNVGDFSRDVRMLACLHEDHNSGQSLMDAARGLIGAFSDLLKAAEPQNQEPRQNLLAAAGKIGEASQDVMNEVGETVQDLDKMFQEALMSLAKGVANATASLVLKAKSVANTTDEQYHKDRVISSATQAALATSQLVACTKVVAPTIGHPACQEQLIEAAKLVAKSVEGIVETSQAACKDDGLLQDLGSAATAVTKALNDLLVHIKKAAQPTNANEQHEEAVDTIINVTDRLFSSVGNAHEMVKQAKSLAQATSTLVTAIRFDADEHTDSDTQKRLLAAAKQLADATHKLVEAAKGCASSPNDSYQQQMLRSAAEELRSATNTAASNALKRRVINKLEASAYHASAQATQLVNAANQAYKTNGNPTSNQQMANAAQMAHCAQNLDQQIPVLVRAMRNLQRHPDSATAQLALINASHEFIQPASRLIAACNAAAPTVSDQAAALHLHNMVMGMSSAVAELRSTANKAQETSTSLEIDSALDQLHELEQDLFEVQQAAEAGKLTTLPGESVESCSSQLGTTSKTVGSSLAQLLTAAAQGNEDYVGIASRDTVNALRILVNSVRGVAATTEDMQIRRAILANAREVISQSTQLLEEAKMAMNDPTNPENQQRLSQMSKSVSNALNNCVNCLPGQRDIDNAIRQITQNCQNLVNPQFPPTNKSYQEVQADMNSTAVNLNQAASDIVSASRGTTQDLAQSSTRYSHNYNDFVHTGLTMAGLTSEIETQNQIVGGLKSVSMVSSKLLVSAKSVSADPNAPNARNLLAQAARAVTESINHLFNICAQSAPGQKECDNALRQIQMMQSMLENANEPVSDLTYFDTLQSVMEKSKDLGDAMTGISNQAKQANMDEFCGCVGNLTQSVCGLTEACIQAAYLVGISDPASEPGRPGVVDHSQFSRANQAIQLACQNLTNPASSQQQVLTAATVVAKHTSALCNQCRVASSKTANPVAKRHLVQSAKDVANSTANLVKAIKALDSDFTDENRHKCAEAAKPLILAVDELTVFTSSPELSSKPAKISAQARQAQEPILQAGRAMTEGACSMLVAAKQLAVNPKDPPTYQLYSHHSKSVSEAIKRLVSSIKDSAPGQHECDGAIEHLNSVMRDLDQASLSAISQNMHPRDEKSHKAYQEQMINSAREILDHIDEIRQSAKEEPQNLGHLVSTVSSYFEPLAKSAVGSASKTVNSKQQMNILDLTKTVAESALQFMYACKESGGNSKATHTHGQIDNAADDMKDVLQDLLSLMEDQASQAGVVNSMIDTITKAIAKTDERQTDRMSFFENLSFVDHQTNMVKLAKQIARTAQDMIGKSSTNPSQLGVMANQLTRDYAQLASVSNGAAIAANNAETGNRIIGTVQDLGKCCVELVQDAGSIQANNSDQYAKRDLMDHARSVNEKVSFVLAALQAGARGTQACINAASTVSGIIGDLDTTIMFASAGTLNDDGAESFADQRENILKTAKSLVEDTKTLVAGAASNQEQLASAAQCAVNTITRLADVVKLGAASLGSDQPDAQVLLINAVKDVASALNDLISATKNASGKAVSDPAMMTLKDSAKVMVTNVTSLLKTVKTVEDEAVRGTRALESSIEAIGQEVKAFDQSDEVSKKASAEDLIRFAKPITTATAKAVAASQSGRQEDIIAAANVGRKAIFDLLSITKGAAATAETHEIRQRAVNAGRSAGIAYKELLVSVQQVFTKPSQSQEAHDARQHVSLMSRNVANSVSELVQSAEAIKEMAEIRWSHVVPGMDWVDPDDPTVIAENELLTAASSIEAAAKKLAQLKPRQQAKKADEELNFEDQILEAAKSIAAATAALVKSASAAQRELVAQGKVGSTYTRHAVDDDGQWSQGLISAAKMVAAATHSLCEAANAMVQGHASEEKLIASAKEVAGSTAQLLMACKVKADPGSMAMQRLQSAGNAVKRATEVLVKAAQQAKDFNEDESSLTVNKRLVGGIAQEIQAQEEILRKEKELEEARKKLAKIRVGKYKDRPQEDDSSY